MITNIDKLTESGCSTAKKDKVCRSRGGESCAFDGAMIVLQPIADTAHVVHGPIACCGNSWEGRGTLSHVGVYCDTPSGPVPLHRMGFTTDLNEMDIVYGAENKLYRAILKTYEAAKPRAIFVYATCVSGMIGEDIEAVCRDAGKKIGVPVIPVNAPGFVGPKNLGNRIAGEVLLDYVIGTGNPPLSPLHLRGDKGGLINVIGEYNIAGDLWLVEPTLKSAGFTVLSRMTGDATFEEITYAHRAKLNVVVCSRALINVAKEMERRYGIPYVEVSFFGKTGMAKALRLISSKFKVQSSKFTEEVEAVIKREECLLEERLEPYRLLKGKRAVLYTGGVKSWSFISALWDLGIEVVAIGTKKSTFEDEEKMKEILGENAPLVEDVTPKNLVRLLKERKADMLIAGGRNQYLAIKEGYPFVDVNQERHVPYAGYEGLVNLAEQISSSMKFYKGIGDWGLGIRKRISDPKPRGARPRTSPQTLTLTPNPLVINPLKHSQSIGAAIAFQGIHRALPVIHGAQGCTFLAKVLLTKHFREPIALASTKLFTEDVVMGGEETIVGVVENFIEKQRPEVTGILTSGLSEVKGDDLAATVKGLQSGVNSRKKEAEDYKRSAADCAIVHVPTPDYEGGLERGYARAVESLIESLITLCPMPYAPCTKGRINVLVGSHLTPADFTELREMIEAFNLRPLILPDLSSLDGSREEFSALALGGTPLSDINEMGLSEFTIALGSSMEPAARLLSERFGIECRIFESIAGLRDMDMFMETLSMLSGKPVPPRFARQRRILVDGMRDAHSYYGRKRVCLALEADLAVQVSRLLDEMGATVTLAVIPNSSTAAEKICARRVMTGDLFSIDGDFDLLISNSHAEDTARRLKVPLYQMGFPVYKVLGKTAQVTIGYKGSLSLVYEIANALGAGH